MNKKELIIELLEGLTDSEDEETEENLMDEKKYDFEDMASDLSYVGNNDPYTADLYFRVLDQLEELAELQKQGAITITVKNRRKEK